MGEHTEYISDTLGLIVSGEHTFGTDALLLAYFASPKRKDLCADFGTGCGIIPFWWLREGCGKEIYAVDIQEKAVGQLTRSVEANGVSEAIHPILSDLRDLKGKMSAGCFDVVTMNPPYKPAGTGIVSQSAADRIARHETACSFDEICVSAARLLRFGGRFCICLKPERMCDAIASMRNAKLEPKRMRLVSQRSGCAPWLMLLEGRSGGKPGMTVERELLIESDEMTRIIGSYRKE